MANGDYLDAAESHVPLGKDSAFGATDVGRKRANNEDALFLHDSTIISPGKLPVRRIFGVADGVGGRAEGEVASRKVVSEIFHSAAHGRFVLSKDFQSINDRVTHGFTTLVLAQSFNDGNSFAVTSVGDSSAILVDSHKRTVRELTPRDENEEGKVTQVMGNGDNGGSFRKPHQTQVHLEPGQTLLLATDGFTKYMDNGKIRPGNVLHTRLKYPDNTTFVRQLINMANAAGGSDNITVVSIPYVPALRRR